jgi:MYXO-CTERM domain-containing protein
MGRGVSTNMKPGSIHMTFLHTCTRAAVLAALCTGLQAQASVTWNWQYDGDAVAAAGTFVTADAPDADGWYQITAITGSRNGVAITGLQPTGTAIPGNEPYAVDNLVRLDDGQLSWDGFGYALANGAYANPFSTGTQAYEYLSTPPYVTGAGLETAVTFHASPVPEPATAWLALAALGALALRRRSAA